MRLRGAPLIEGPDETDREHLEALGSDPWMQAGEPGDWAWLDSLEDGLSHSVRIGDRTGIAWGGRLQDLAEHLSDECVEGDIRPFVTHLPLYGLRRNELHR